MFQIPLHPVDYFELGRNGNLMTYLVDQNCGKFDIFEMVPPLVALAKKVTKSYIKYFTDIFGLYQSYIS